MDEKETKKKRIRKYPKILQIKKDGVDAEALNVAIKLAIVILGMALISFLGVFLSTLGGPVLTVLNVAVPFIVAIVLAWLIQPLYIRLSQKIKGKYVASGASVLLLLLVISVMVTGISLMLGTTVTSELSTTISGNDLTVTCLNEESTCTYVTNILGGGNTATISNINETVLDFLGLPSSQLEIVAARLLGIVTNWFYYLLIIVTTMVYMLPMMGKISGSIKKNVPKKYRETFSDIYDIGTESFVGYMGGTLKIALIVGGIVMAGVFLITLASNIIPGNSIGLLAFNGTLNNLLYIGLAVLAIGLFVGSTNIIPFIGPFIGGIPVILLVFLTEQFEVFPYYTALVALLILVIQQIDGNILKPMILGGIAKLNAVVVLFGLTLFGSLFGIVGFLIATPVLAMTRSIIVYLDEIYDIF
jgi:predicted PurR-regulated permease PerM